MIDRQKIRKVITETLSSAFSDVRVRDIKFDEEMESDGTEILAISVIFSGKLDAKKMPDVVASMRDKLGRIPKIAFPVLSFISQSDIEHRKRATR